MNETHNLTVEDQKRITVTQVEEVDSFSDTQITLKLRTGEKITVTGEGLKIQCFQKTDGTFRADGKIISFKYGVKSKAVAKKLFG